MDKKHHIIGGIIVALLFVVIYPIYLIFMGTIDYSAIFPTIPIKFLIFILVVIGSIISDFDKRIFNKHRHWFTHTITLFIPIGIIHLIIKNPLTAALGIGIASHFVLDTFYIDKKKIHFGARGNITVIPSPAEEIVLILSAIIILGFLFLGWFNVF